MRYAAKVDAVQPACVKLWRQHGKVWIPTHRQGDGAPDGFLLHQGVFLAVEVKAPKAKVRKGKQATLHEVVAAKGGRIYVVRSEEDAAALIGARLAA
jgi:hypothetical protein